MHAMAAAQAEFLASFQHVNLNLVTLGADVGDSFESFVDLECSACYSGDSPVAFTTGTCMHPDVGMEREHAHLGSVHASRALVSEHCAG